MKKLLGLLAMILVISSLSLAENDQDILKNISLDSKWSQTYYDKDGNDANRLGNEGFKKKNKERFRWTEEVEGTLDLNNEWGLDANFHYREHNDRFYEDGKRTQAKGAEKFSVIEFAKAAQWGSLDTTTKLGWRNWTYRENGGVGSQHTVGQSNEFYFGPTFNLKIFGQNVTTTAEAVYFNQRGTANQDSRYYTVRDKNGEIRKTDGLGANLIFNIGNTIFDNGFGKADYYVNLAHYLRDGKAKDAKDSVGLAYLTGIGYQTPSFAGFYAGLNVENEFKKRTAKSGFTNEFSVWTHLGYKADIDTPVGVITINPRIGYRPVDKNYKKGNAWKYDYYNSDSKRKIEEENELNFGLKVGLTVK